MNGGVFRVDPGDLGFSVLIFCVEACICIAALMYRRYSKNIQAELGGPAQSRKLTSLCLVGLWITYIILSSLQSYCYINVSF